MGGQRQRPKGRPKQDQRGRPKGEVKGEAKGEAKAGGQSGRPNVAKLSHPLVLHATMRWRNRLQAKRIKQLSQRGPLSNPHPPAP